MKPTLPQCTFLAFQENSGSSTRHFTHCQQITQHEYEVATSDGRKTITKRKRTRSTIMIRDQPTRSELNIKKLTGRKKTKISTQHKKVRAAIVTCGGLCPGLNDVIRQIVFTLQVYGVNDILGVQYGFRGFIDKDLPPIPCHKRKMRMVVVCIPKTIDNDILLIERTFGFDTAVEEAQHAINAAYVEASSAYNGIGIVKLMGRQSGFIAMHATLASGQVDVVLIPEISFEMEGKHGVLHFMRTRLEKNGLCVVVIAEGAAQDFVEEEGNYDASGNPVLGDIGKWFVSQVKEYFKKLNMSIDLKYIDPTYLIRARPSNAADHILCTVLGQNAVHGAFAGYTNITVGLVNTHYCYLPIPEVIKHPRRVDPNSNMWHRCVTSTGQPDFVPPVPDVVPMEFPLSQRRANSFIQYQGQAQSSS